MTVQEIDQRIRSRLVIKYNPRSFIVFLLLFPACAWMAFFYITPIAMLVYNSLAEDGLSILSKTVANPVYRSVFATTLEIGAASTLGCLLLGYPVAYALTVSRGALRGILLIIVGLPYWLDYVVRSFSWMVLLGQRGLINNFLLYIGVIDKPIQIMYTFLSVCIGMVQILLPIMILTLFAAMLRIDRRLMTAAAIHGAPPWKAFRTVFFPLSLPGVYAASLLVFISSLGFYITSALLGSPKESMISQSITLLAATLLKWSDASALSLVLLAITMAIVIVYDRVFSIDDLWGGKDA